jgi:hypothetical protein
MLRRSVIFPAQVPVTSAAVAIHANIKNGSNPLNAMRKRAFIYCPLYVLFSSIAGRLVARSTRVWKCFHLKSIHGVYFTPTRRKLTRQKRPTPLARQGESSHVRGRHAAQSEAFLTNRQMHGSRWNTHRR